MLRGEKVGLRARVESDVAVLHAELYDDVWTRSRADARPWLPLSPTSAGAPFKMAEPGDDCADFSVVDLASGEALAGSALLWSIDRHNRSAHIGISMRPASRGRGLALDAVRVLCVYGFQIRGLHRLSIETLGDNDAMIRVAQKAGFVLEGVLRRAAWIEGGFVDEVVFGLLADEWAGTWTAGSLPGRPAVAPGGREDASGNRLAEPGGLDDVVDEAGRESFPASDAPAF